MGRNCKKSCECNREYVLWETCTGEAHSNPYIDNCGVCMPEWGRIPFCPNCWHERLVESSNAEKLYCRAERKHYYR